jgi:anaerobic magnesium-protoporphyrin IX monomethyl ester cyclase
MKVLLVNPPDKTASWEARGLPPLGLAYLAAMLERDGYPVKIIDAEALGWSWAFFAGQMRKEKADLIGMGSYTPTAEKTFRAMKICRPHTRYLVMGGPHLSVRKQEIFKECPSLDFGIAGEGDISFPALVRRLDAGAEPGDVPGLVTRDRFNPPGNAIGDLDKLPFPARHLLHNDLYFYGPLCGMKVTSLLASRGCPYQCTYCDRSIFGSKWRARSPQNIIDEIEHIVKDLKIHAFAIGDDIFTFNKQWVREICQGILDRGLDVQWKCSTRVDRVDEETLRWMKKAGCSVIAYGIESGNQVTLDYLKKGLTLAQVRQAVEMTHRAEIAIIGYFMLGIPTETFAQAMKTIEFAKELKVDIPGFTFLSSIQGTEFFEEAEAKGWHQSLKAFGMDVTISENWPIEALMEIYSIALKEFVALDQISASWNRERNEKRRPMAASFYDAGKSL